MKKFDEESMEEMEEHVRFMVEEKRELRENEIKRENVKVENDGSITFRALYMGD